MSIAETVAAVILLVISALAAYFGVRQLRCKGRCLNNAYIFASKEERNQTDFTPYYKQSGKVLLMLSALFLLNCVRIVFKIKFLFWVSIALIAGILAYAVVSSVMIEKNK